MITNGQYGLFQRFSIQPRQNLRKEISHKIYQLQTANKDGIDSQNYDIDDLDIQNGWSVYVFVLGEESSDFPRHANAKVGKSSQILLQKWNHL